MRQTRRSSEWLVSSAPRAAVLFLAAASLAAGALAAGALAAEPRRSPDADLKFAREMASQGLWREAIFRWERALAALPPGSENAGRVLNNIGVAAEALGQHDRARAAYEKAAALTRDKEIVANYELFRRAHTAVAAQDDAGAGPGTGAGAGSDAAAGAGTDAGTGAAGTGGRMGTPPPATPPPDGPAGPPAPGSGRLAPSSGQ